VKEVGQWDGLAIAQWLATLGCDIRSAGADGTTLLQIAAEAGDAKFVRYLLDQKIDPSTPGRYGLPALGSVEDEDVALILLEAGTDLSKMDEDGISFRRYAQGQHWSRVTRWLEQHDR
jgi:ankyrin repeat protein